MKGGSYDADSQALPGPAISMNTSNRRALLPLRPAHRTRRPPNYRKQLPQEGGTNAPRLRINLWVRGIKAEGSFASLAEARRRPSKEERLPPGATARLVEFASGPRSPFPHATAPTHRSDRGRLQELPTKSPPHPPPFRVLRSLLDGIRLLSD